MVKWLLEFAESRTRVPGRDDARSAERLRSERVITGASRIDLAGPPPRTDTSTQIDYMLEPLLDDHLRSWALAHTVNVVWRPVLTSVGVGVRADQFYEASAVDPEVFLAIVTGARKGRTTWRGGRSRSNGLRYRHSGRDDRSAQSAHVRPLGRPGD